MSMEQGHDIAVEGALTRLADQAMYAAKRSKIERFVVLTT